MEELVAILTRIAIALEIQNQNWDEWTAEQRIWRDADIARTEQIIIAQKQLASDNHQWIEEQRQMVKEHLDQHLATMHRFLEQ